jgi:hypothetical protein
LFDVDYLDIDTSCSQQHCVGWFLRRRTSITDAKDEGLGICDLPGAAELSKPLKPLLSHQDAVFYDPKGGVYRGRDEIDRIAGELRVMHPDFRYQPIGEPEEVGNAGRVRWTEGRPAEAPAVAGTDFIVARDGRIAAIYLFFDKLP